MDDSILEGNLCDIEQQIDAEIDNIIETDDNITGTDDNITETDDDNIYTKPADTIEYTDSVDEVSDGMDDMTDINKDSDGINVTYDEGLGQKEDTKTNQNIDNNEAKMEDVLASLTPEQIRQLYIKQMEQTQNMNMFFKQQMMNFEATPANEAAFAGAGAANMDASSQFVYNNVTMNPGVQQQVAQYYANQFPVPQISNQNKPQEEVKESDLPEKEVFKWFYTLLDIESKIITKPVTTAKELVAKKKMAVPISLYIIQAIFTAIFGLIYIVRAFSENYTTLTEKNMDVIQGYALDAKIPYVKAFCMTFLLSLGLTYVLLIVTWMFGRLFRLKISFAEMVNVVGARSGILIFTNIIAIILTFVNPEYGITFFCFSDIIGFAIMALCYPSKDASKENKVLFALSISIIAYMFIEYRTMAFGMGYYLPRAIMNQISMEGGLFGKIANVLYQLEQGLELKKHIF